MKIFIHISDDSLYLGNGGLRSQTHLAQACQEMGYETWVFGQRDKLTWQSFHWLAWPKDHLDFDIASRVSVQTETGDHRIVSSWLNRIMGQMDKWDIENIRYLERDELARGKYISTANFIQKNFDKIGITNRSLIPYYSQFGFKEIVPLENWFRRDLFYYNPEKKIGGTIGYQGARKDEYKRLKHRSDVIVCEGNQTRVAARMRRADFFVYLNSPKRSVTLYNGEGFGNPLYEAMACGCICLAVKHQGNIYLKDTIPLVHDVSEAITLKHMLSESKKNEIRERSLALIEERFRLNDAKKKKIERFLA